MPGEPALTDSDEPRVASFVAWDGTTVIGFFYVRSDGRLRPT
jgi:hypothetical protein